VNTRDQLEELIGVLTNFRACLPGVEQGGRMLLAAVQQGRKVLTCGNGGSAADALHLAEELVGRYREQRRSLPGICLNADPTAITCIANDYGFDHVFARQVEGLGSQGDVLVAFSTSGNSPSILNAITTAKSKGLVTLALLGKGGGKARGLADLDIIIPTDVTARVQEVHTFVLHSWLEMIDSGAFL
jgi:D-sedoheptulose 7-phosphate isomerase